MRSQKLASTRAAKRRSTASGSERHMYALPERVVIAGEDPRQLETLREELEAEFNPQSAEQCELVVRAASELWRLRRASVIESALIEAFRTERDQTDPEKCKRYQEAIKQAGEPYFEQLLKKYRRGEKACVDAAPPTPKMSVHEVPSDKELVKLDLSFVREPSFQDSLCRLARYETQLMQELSRTLRLLPQNSTKPQRRGATKKPTGSTERTVIWGEDIEQFEHMRAVFERQLEPQTAAERELVERIAWLSWRLRRVPVFEATLMEGARADFQPAKRPGEAWFIDGPDGILSWSSRYGKELTAAEAEAKWKEVSEEQREIEKKAREIVGDEGREHVLPHLWFMRGRDIQDQLAKMASYERALSRQLASTHKLLHFLQTQRPAAKEGTPVHRKSRRP
jgi:hypothetical protein